MVTINDTEMYSTHNYGKSVVAERFIKPQRIKYTTSALKIVYINKLDNIKMETIDAYLSIYIDLNKENTKEDPKFEVDDHVRISKYKNIFAKDYVSNWSEKGFEIKEVKNIVPWTDVISDFNPI